MIKTDFDEFFRLDDFAEEMRLADGNIVRGIFDAQHQSLAGSVVEGAGPAFTTAEQWVEGVRRDDIVTLRETAYRVVGREPDGTGEIVLKLQRA